MYFLKLNGTLYEASFTGKMQDKEFNNRETKTIHTSENITSLVSDDMSWSIVNQYTITRQKMDEEGNPMYDEDGNPIMEEVTEEEEFDNSDYCVLGDIVLHNTMPPTYSITMGKETEEEKLLKLLYGGV